MIYGGVVLKKRTIIILIIAMIILLLGLYLYLENSTLQVTKFDIKNSKIPKDFNNYKIIQVSDFHNTTSEKLYNDLVEEIKTQKPNIIVLTGDLIDSRKTDTNVVINFLKDIISHRPEEFNTYVSENIDLVFTGHAHGGQIRIPFVGGVVAPNQGFFPKYTSGKYVKKNTTMIVSRGIGNSIIPFRINNRPELIVVELRSE